MIQAVLDTNIIVSALLKPQGLPAQVFVLAVTSTELQLCISGEIYAEYEEVIRRPRLRLAQSDIESALKAVRAKGVWFRPSTKLDACTDPDDNIFLECALVAQASFLVTGNLRDFPSIFQNTRIVSARQMLDAISFETRYISRSEPPKPF